MFSGLITHIGRFIRLENQHLEIQGPSISLKPGDSIAVNGVCLTLIKKHKKGKHQIFKFDLSNETLKKTTLQHLTPGTMINLEPALKLSNALGGHIVQGHIDGVGEVLKIRKTREMKNITFRAPKSIMKFVVPKGSITVDGVSLTAINIAKNQFSVALIPYTLHHTNLNQLQSGNKVNLEADVIGKYVQRYLKQI